MRSRSKTNKYKLCCHGLMYFEQWWLLLNLYAQRMAKTPCVAAKKTRCARITRNLCVVMAKTLCPVATETPPSVEPVKDHHTVGSLSFL
ncbi:hypothetical protein TSUD_187520 [Trifolium subterraneum]|uniref:Uncharacterized protein n=1 Tax=Trifolium subterraneum TaxID=3900 RepID=A0A2Z6NY21_TRISU|nr:hypothetical protein TSUD_187520 [Trifolium subterraneum]